MIRWCGIVRYIESKRVRWVAAEICGGMKGSIITPWLTCNKFRNLSVIIFMLFSLIYIKKISISIV